MENTSLFSFLVSPVLLSVHLPFFVSPSSPLSCLALSCLALSCYGGKPLSVDKDFERKRVPVGLKKVKFKERGERRRVSIKSPPPPPASVSDPSCALCNLIYNTITEKTEG